MISLTKESAHADEGRRRRRNKPDMNYICITFKALRRLNKTVLDWHCRHQVLNAIQCTIPLSWVVYLHCLCGTINPFLETVWNSFPTEGSVLSVLSIHNNAGELEILMDKLAKCSGFSDSFETVL
jgi:hypothetical protein